MTDLKALAAALHKHDYLRTTWQTHFIEDDSPILTAARERLAQLEADALIEEANKE